MNTKPVNVDEYIASFPLPAREKLSEIREILRESVPDAVEELKWGKPVFIKKRILFSFSGHKNFLLFMPTAPSMLPFGDELSSFKCGKDTIQFTYDKPLPVDLIRKIAGFRYNDVMLNDAKWMY